MVLRRRARASLRAVPRSLHVSITFRPCTPSCTARRVTMSVVVVVDSIVVVVGSTVVVVGSTVVVVDSMVVVVGSVLVVVVEMTVVVVTGGPNGQVQSLRHAVNAPPVESGHVVMS